MVLEGSEAGVGNVYLMISGYKAFQCHFWHEEPLFGLLGFKRIEV